MATTPKKKRRPPIEAQLSAIERDALKVMLDGLRLHKRNHKSVPEGLYEQCAAMFGKKANGRPKVSARTLRDRVDKSPLPPEDVRGPIPDEKIRRGTESEEVFVTTLDGKVHRVRRGPPD